MIEVEKRAYNVSVYEVKKIWHQAQKGLLVKLVTILRIQILIWIWTDYQVIGNTL